MTTRDAMAFAIGILLDEQCCISQDGTQVYWCSLADGGYQIVADASEDESYIVDKAVAINRFLDLIGVPKED